jgi:hypothetical protein
VEDDTKAVEGGVVDEGLRMRSSRVPWRSFLAIVIYASKSRGEDELVSA